MGIYDVLILDIMMPGMDGLTVLRTLRGEGNTTPVLLLTAKGEVRDKVLGFESGSDDYLSKPFALDELRVRVDALTRRARSCSCGTRIFISQRIRCWTGSGAWTRRWTTARCGYTSRG